MNDLIVTKKSKFMKQSETFFSVLSSSTYTDDRYMLSYLLGHCSSSKYSLSEVNLFQFSYLNGKGSHIKNLSDLIEGVYFS